MRAGETRMLALVVVGSVSSPVTYEVKNAPAFATLEGAVLTLSPQRQDAGEYAMDLVATAGRESQTTSLHLTVMRFNSAPRASFQYGIRFGDSSGSRGACIYAPTPPGCTLGPDPYVTTLVCDPDGDAMTVDVEVVPRGTAFSKKPGFSVSAPAMYPPDPRSGNCANVVVAMPGLAPEQSYDFAIRARDQFGAVALTPGFPDGWYRSDRTAFDQGPCEHTRCACREPTGECDVGMDCCSGVCLVSPQGGRSCQ